MPLTRSGTTRSPPVGVAKCQCYCLAGPKVIGQDIVQGREVRLHHGLEPRFLALQYRDLGGILSPYPRSHHQKDGPQNRGPLSDHRSSSSVAHSPDTPSPAHVTASSPHSREITRAELRRPA